METCNISVIENFVMELNEPYDDDWDTPYTIDANGFCVLVRFAGQVIFHSLEYDYDVPLKKEFFEKKAKKVLQYLADPESIY